MDEDQDGTVGAQIRGVAYELRARGGLRDVPLESGVKVSGFERHF